MADFSTRVLALTSLTERHEQIIATGQKLTPQKQTELLQMLQAFDRMAKATNGQMTSVEEYAQTFVNATERQIEEAETTGMPPKPLS